MVLTRTQLADLADYLELDSECDPQYLEEALCSFEGALRSSLSEYKTPEEVSTLMMQGAVWWSLLAIILEEDEEWEEMVGVQLASAVCVRLSHFGYEVEEALTDAHCSCD